MTKNRDKPLITRAVDTALVLLAGIIIVGGGLTWLVVSNADTKSSDTQEPSITPIQTCYSSGISASDLVAYTNSERAKANLPLLSENTSLDKAAALHAADMTSLHYYAHKSPSGFEPWHWYGVAGYNYSYAGENIAEGYQTAATVVEAWMHSPEHKANILNPKYTEVGFAVTCGVTDRETTLTVAEYGSPK